MGLSVGGEKGAAIIAAPSRAKRCGWEPRRDALRFEGAAARVDRKEYRSEDEG
jgi:hypothetical protein